MKIIFLTFYFKPDLCAGSFRSESLVNELSKQLADGDELTVLTTMPQRYRSFEVDAVEEEVVGNLKIVRFYLPSHNSGFLDQIKSFVSYYRQVLAYVYQQQYDVVFATSSRLFTAFLGARVARKKKVTLLLDIRDIFRDTMRSLLSKPLFLMINPVLKCIENYTFNTASKINLVSDGFNDYFKSRFPAVQYSNFYNGIDDIFLDFNFEKTSVTRRTIITYAGNIGQGQGIEIIVPQMAQRLGDDYEIHVIGDGGQKPVLIQNLEKLHLTNVKLFSPVPRLELLSFYKESDFLFLHLNDFPAFEKVLPSKVFEYAATNKPIIAGVGGFARSFIDENIDDAILFSPCDIASFSTAFAAHRSSCSHRGESFGYTFSRERISKEMVSVFFELD